MTEKKNGRARKIAAGSLLGLGLLGLGVAAASQLDLVWGGNFQAGAVEVKADCQTDEIAVGCADPAFAGAADVPWSIASVSFSDIDGKCLGLAYETAYKVDGGTGWVKLSGGTVGGDVITNSIPEDADVQEITDFALTIHGNN